MTPREDAIDFLLTAPEGTWFRLINTKLGRAIYTPLSRRRNFMLWLRFSRDRYRWSR